MVKRDSAAPQAIASIVAWTVSALVCTLGCDPQRAPTEDHRPAASASVAVAVKPRTDVLPNYPCSQCHLNRDGGPTRRTPDGGELRAPDGTERKLTELHERIELKHGQLEGWCYRCHSTDDVDQLRIDATTRVSFDASYELCGACHQSQLDDWRAQVHGLTTGQWNGPRLSRSCTGCHDPHEPAFGGMQPLPPPRRPRTLAPRGDHP